MGIVARRPPNRGRNVRRGKDWIEFDWEIQTSFINDLSHPITIPSAAQFDVRRLDRRAGRRIMDLPGPHRLDGRIYRGVGYTQVRTSGGSVTATDKLAPGQPVVVRVELVGKTLIISVSPAPD